MSVTYGFFNSYNHDRRYNAEEFSRLFEGIIRDGVFMAIGGTLVVLESSGMTVNVSTGRCWFNNTWLNNDALYPVTIDPAEVVLTRIDAVVVEVNTALSVRANSIKVVKGVPSSEPERPTLTNYGDVHQYPLAYITVNSGVSAITQVNIENCVGTEACPFITGIIQTANISSLLLQWNAQWAEWLETQGEATTIWKEAFQNAFEADFDDWLEHLQTELDDDVAGNLQNQIDDLAELNFKQFYEIQNKSTVINKNSLGTVSSIVETSSDAVATTQFSDSNGSKIISTLLVPTAGRWQYTKTVTITNTSTGTTIEESYTKGPKT